MILRNLEVRIDQISMGLLHPNHQRFLPMLAFLI
jgi:hypothetical protein